MEMDRHGRTLFWVSDSNPSLYQHHNTKSFHKPPETYLRPGRYFTSAIPIERLFKDLLLWGIDNSSSLLTLMQLHMIYTCFFSPSHVVLYLLGVINLLSSFIRLAKSILIDFHSPYYSGSFHLVKVYLILPSRAEHCTQYSRWGLSWASHNWTNFSFLLTVSWHCPFFHPFFFSLMLVLHSHPVIEQACFSLIMLVWTQLMAILLTAEDFALNLNVSSFIHYPGLSIHLHPISSLVLKVIQFSE